MKTFMMKVAWYYFKLVVLPLAAWAGAMFNGDSFAGIHYKLANTIEPFLSWILPFGFSYTPALFIAYLPSLLAYPLPPGFSYTMFVFGGLVGGPGMIFLFYFLFFLAIRSPFAKKATEG